MFRFLRIIPLAAAALLPAVASAGDLQPNELGRVMILEYHKIDLPEERWTRTPANFRRDLERLWERGYRLVALNDLLDGRIGIRRGTTPVVLTFDDSSPGQFKLIEKNGDWYWTPIAPSAFSKLSSVSTPSSAMPPPFTSCREPTRPTACSTRRSWQGASSSTWRAAATRSAATRSGTRISPSIPSA